MKFVKLTLCALSMLLMSCTAQHRLSYVPDPCDVEVHVSQKKNISQDLQSHSLLVETFTDERSNSSAIATVYLYGIIPFIDLEPKDNFSDWYTQLFRYELAKSGLKIHRDKESDLTVRGQILQNHSKGRYITFRGKFAVNVAVYRKEEKIFEKTYLVKKSGSDIFLANEKSIQAIVQSFLPDLHTALHNLRSEEVVATEVDLPK